MPDLEFKAIAELDANQMTSEIEKVSDGFDDLEKRGNEALEALGKASLKSSSRIRKMKSDVDSLKGRHADLSDSIRSPRGFLGSIVKLAPAAAKALGAIAPVAAAVLVAFGAVSAAIVTTFNKAKEAIEPVRQRLRFREEAREFQINSKALERSIDRLTGKTLTSDKIIDLAEGALQLDDFSERLDDLAEKEFGVPADSLSDIERAALAAEIALDRARDAGELFAGSFDDAGAPIERLESAFDDFKTQVSEASLILVDTFLRGLFTVADAVGVFNDSLGNSAINTDQLLQKLTALFITSTQAKVQGLLATFSEIGAIIQEAIGDPTILLDPAALGERVRDSYREAFVETADDVATELKQRFDIMGEGIGSSFVGSIDEEADEIADKAEDALDKLEQLELDHQRRLDDITQRGADQRLENEIKAADKRVDIATKAAQRIEDAEKKFSRDVDKAARGLSQDEAALARRQGRERIEVERDIANDRIDIERRFREQLRDIQRDFELDARDAAIRGDFATLRRLRRRREGAIDEAKTERRDSLAEAQRESAERRKIIQSDQAFELQELRTRNQERLNELRIRLDQELADINTAKERELAEAEEAERRKSDALDRELERRREAEAVNNQRRLDDFLAKLDEEVRAVVEAERQKAETRDKWRQKELQAKARTKQEDKGSKEKERREESTERQRSEAQERADDRRTRSQRNRDDALRRFRNTFSRRQFGGPVTGGQSVIVGEAGAELFTPNTSGTVLPSSRLGRLPAPINNVATSNIDNSIQATVNQSMLDPSEQNAIMRSIARAEAQRVLTNVLRR